MVRLLITNSSLDGLDIGNNLLLKVQRDGCNCGFKYGL